MKVKNDHRSKFSNLSNWKEEAWKKSGLQRDSNPWPPRCRCVALPTELWSHTLGARSICWAHISREEWNDVKYMKSSIWSEVTGSNPVEALIFFRLLLSNCLNWKIYNLCKRNIYSGERDTFSGSQNWVQPPFRRHLSPKIMTDLTLVTMLHRPYKSSASSLFYVTPHFKCLRHYCR